MEYGEQIKNGNSKRQKNENVPVWPLVKSSKRL